MIKYKTYDIPFLKKILNKSIPKFEKILLKFLKISGPFSYRLCGENKADRAYATIACVYDVLTILSKKRMCFSCAKIKAPINLIVPKDFTIRHILSLREHIVNKSRKGIDKSYYGLVNVHTVLYDRITKASVSFAKIKFLALTCSEECTNVYILQQNFKANTKDKEI